MNTPEQREETLFNAALQLATPAERAEYLKKACPDDEALRRRVEALLQAHEKDSAFLEHPAAPSLAKTVLVKTAVIPPAEGVGDRIGRYKLLQQIGEGGCGIVYMAEQEEPVRRRVALKVIKLGMDTKEVIARFEAERQALALMDHPNIAKVFDAGATEKGRPFFVMELVRGIKITDYCDQNNLPTSERLKLFGQVCQAVQHAHQKGIIHRDLKPSNVLVTLHDGVPVPKVIDFGIAKATTDQRLTDKTLFTAFEQFIGTPAYMSPEQAEMSGLEIDIRSDIYSLGVLLYELLTGETPFDPRQLLKAGLDEMRRIIRESEPARPSTRLSTMLEGELTAAAKCRQTEAPKLVHLVRGDLDWIVMKCLEKDRTRRYDAANSLAADIQRHLDHQPIAARPPSEFYRMQKLIHRNRAAFAVGGVTAIAVLAALMIGMQISRITLPKNEKSFTAARDHIASVSSPTPANAFTNVIASAPPDSTITNAVVSKPPPMSPVSGVVIAEESGRPLSNVLVRVASPAVAMRHIRQGGTKLYDGRTDQDGRFKIQVPGEETISIDAFLPDYESAAGPYNRMKKESLDRLRFGSNSGKEFTVKLKPALYVAGVVVDESGRPFSGAYIEATERTAKSLGYLAYTKTDKAGRFEIFDFPLKARPGVTGHVAFENVSMLRSRIENVYALTEEERRNIRITMRRGQDITGVLISSGGKPAAKVELSATPKDYLEQDKRTVTDDKGRFTFRGIPNGPVTVRAHSLELEQKIQTNVVLAGANVELNLRLEPVILKSPPPSVTLFGMKLADVTPELKEAYDLYEDKGVLIVDPGPNHHRLGIGNLKEGYYFWMVGNKSVRNLREMVTELIRLSAIDPPKDGGFINAGHRGFIRVVYTYRKPGGTNTQYIKLNDEDLEELKKLAAVLARKETSQ